MIFILDIGMLRMIIFDINLNLFLLECIDLFINLRMLSKFWIGFLIYSIVIVNYYIVLWWGILNVIY